MKLLSGKSVAGRILSDVKKKITESGIKPGIAVILIGNDKASHVYITLKEKKAGEAGFYFEKHLFLAEAKTEEIINLIEKLNDRLDIHGILVQLPLPKHMDTDAIIEAIAPVKDADGFHKETIKKFLAGDEECMPVFPQAIIEMIKESGVTLTNKKAVLVVNSSLFGDTLKKALEIHDITVQVIQSAEIEKHKLMLKKADVIVTACGRHGLITGEMVKEGSLIIDGGTCEFEGKTVGDVDVKNMENLDVVLTPVPGGVGPVTVVCLLRNIARLAGISL